MVLEIKDFKCSTLLLLYVNWALCSAGCAKSQERNHSFSLETHSVTCNMLWPGRRSLSTDTVCWQNHPCNLCSVQPEESLNAVTCSHPVPGLRETHFMQHHCLLLLCHSMLERFRGADLESTSAGVSPCEPPALGLLQPSIIRNK